MKSVPAVTALSLTIACGTAPPSTAVRASEAPSGVVRASEQEASTQGARPPAPRPFPAERGRLRVEGSRFYDADDQVWQWRGATQFLLFARFLNGEDIGPQLDWLIDRGFNVVRVFGEVPDGFQSAQRVATNYERPFERPDFEAGLDAFFTLLEARGLRCEYTVLTYGDAMDVMRAHVQRVFAVASSHWNVLVEVANEPEHNRIDAFTVMKGVDRRGVLASYGLDPARTTVAQWKEVPLLDYGTTHDLNRNLRESPYATKAALEMQKTLGVPFVSDEPIGAIEPGHPLFKETGVETYGGINGGGARTVNQDVFVSAAAIAYMFTAGYTFHFQAGVESRVPPSGSIEDRVALALRELAIFLRPELQLGVLAEPGAPDFGLAGVGAPIASSPIDRAYAVVLGERQWVVVPMAPPSWFAKPANGWRIDGVGPVRYVVRLVK